LRVYQAAELLDGEVLSLLANIGRGHSSDLNQLRRASGSVTNNIAEAHGSEQIGRKASFLEIARGSCDETRAVLRRLVRGGALSDQQVQRASRLSMAVSKMLTAWIVTLNRTDSND
jgi:four helix bundle protein